MPLTESGKVDRCALRPVTGPARTTHSLGVSPSIHPLGAHRSISDALVDRRCLTPPRCSDCATNLAPGRRSAPPCSILWPSNRHADQYRVAILMVCAPSGPGRQCWACPERKASAPTTTSSISEVGEPVVVSSRMDARRYQRAYCSAYNKAITCICYFSKTMCLY